MSQGNEISRSNPGPSDTAPYCPTWCYENNSPMVCTCGHHEGFHNDLGECLNRKNCGCEGFKEKSDS